MFQPPRTESLGATPTGGKPDEKNGAAPTGAAARFQIGPSIEKLLAIPPNLDGLTPLQAADCFLKSEEFYVERALRVACEMETRLRFHIKLNKTILLEQEIVPLFLNLQQIYSFNRKFYSEILKLRLHGNIVESVGQCVLQHCPFFRLYKEYIRDYRKSQAFCDILLEKKKKFLEWLDLNELCAGYSLKTLLLAPVTRLPQYLVFLGAIVRSLDPESESAKKILQAITAVSQVSDDIAFGLKDEVSRKLVVTIQAKIFGNNCNLVSPHRFVVKHSDLKKMYNKSLFGGSSKVYLFVLFNDCLIYGTRPGKLSSGTVKHVLPLIGMSISEESDDEKKKIKNGFKIHSNTKSFVCCAINGPTKQSWVKTLRDQIQLANTSASTLQKGPEAADAFERHIKNKPSKADEQANANAQAQAAAARAAGGVATAQQRTFVPIQSSTNSVSTPSSQMSHTSSSNSQASFSMPPPPSSSHASFSSPYSPPPPAPPSSHASFSMPPPPAPSSGGYGSPPPPAPSAGGYGSPPPPPRPSPPAPPTAPSFGAPPPAPPPSFARPPPPVPPPSAYSSQYTQDYGAQQDDYSDANENGGGGYIPPSSYADDIPSAPTLEYDIPVIGSGAPPPPPMAPPAPSFVSSPKVDLLSQIQAGKALRSTEPQWVQILDPSSGAFYYEHKQTGESVWEPPESFVPAAGGGTSGGGGGSGSVLSGSGGQAMENQLKATLDRYRQFVQDEEDDVQECGDDEWD